MLHLERGKHHVTISTARHQGCICVANLCMESRASVILRVGFTIRIETTLVGWCYCGEMCTSSVLRQRWLSVHHSGRRKVSEFRWGLPCLTDDRALDEEYHSRKMRGYE